MGYKRTIYKIWLWASRKGGTWIYLTQTGTSERSDYGSSMIHLMKSTCSLRLRSYRTARSGRTESCQGPTEVIVCVCMCFFAALNPNSKSMLTTGLKCTRADRWWDFGVHQCYLKNWLTPWSCVWCQITNRTPNCRANQEVKRLNRFSLKVRTYIRITSIFYSKRDRKEHFIY